MTQEIKRGFLRMACALLLAGMFLELVVRPIVAMIWPERATESMLGDLGRLILGLMGVGL